MSGQRGIVVAGAALLWRRQRVLWWIFLVNLVLGMFSGWPVRTRLATLDRSSAASAGLYHSMNLARLTEAFKASELSFLFSGSLGLILIYLIFLLFVMGGLLETFYTDRRLARGEFFRAAGEFFWRMVRLMLLFGVLLIPIALISSPLQDWADKVGGASDREMLGFWLLCGITVFLLLAALAVRVLVDVAQVHLVAENEHSVVRSIAHAWRLLRGRFLRLYASVLLVQVLLGVATLALFAVWVKLPHEALTRTLFVGELIVLLWLAFRLWQRAVETVWYQRTVVLHAAPPASAPLIYDMPPAAPLPPSEEIPREV